MGWMYDGGDWARIDNGTLQLKSLDGSWFSAGRPEHAESLSYVTRAADDPEVDKLVAYARANPAGLNAEQSAFLANPIVGFDSFGQGYRWGALNLFDGAFSDQQAGALLLTGGASYLSDADRAAGAAFVERESAQAQAARNDDGGMLGLGEWADMVALAAAAYFGGAALGAWGGAGEAAAASTWTAADAAATYGTFESVGVTAYVAPTAASVSPATWAAFGNTASTADLYAAATSSAINTSVADYAAAAVAGDSVGAMSAFSSGLPISSLSGAAASPGFFSGAFDAVKSIAQTGKQAADVVKVISSTTGKAAVIPKSTPVPAGWNVDSRWTAPQLAQQRGEPMPATAADTGIVAASGSVVPFLAIAAALAAVLYLVK